jgi:hypothetical protein
LRREASLRLGDGYLLVYSIDDRASFEDVQKTFTIVNRGNEGRAIRIMVIGNKCVRVSSQRPARASHAPQDLESDRKVTTKEAADWAASKQISHLETSAKVCAVSHQVRQLIVVRRPTRT